MEKSTFSMKNRFMWLVIACVVGGGQAMAQERITFGVKAGVNFASFSIVDNRGLDDDYKKRPNVSFHVGGLVDVPLSSAFSLQGGLTLSGKGSREIWSNDDELGGSYSETSFKESLLYLELPVNAVYKAGNFFVGAGPYAGYALSGKWKETFEEDFGDGDVEKEEDSGNVIFSGENAYRERIDFGVNFLAGYQFNSRMNISLGYGLGLKNIYKRDEWTMKNRVLSLSVGYTF